MSIANALTVVLLGLAPCPAHADADPFDCPILLTDRECDAYLAERRQATSPGDKALFEEKYAALLQERYRLCPCPAGAFSPDLVRRGGHGMTP